MVPDGIKTQGPQAARLWRLAWQAAGDIRHNLRCRGS